MASQISPLRQRMIDDMTLHNMAPSTQKVYAYAVANFARYHGTSPDQLGLEEIRDYRLHLVARGLKATSINPIIGALRFFRYTRQEADCRGDPLCPQGRHPAGSADA